MFERLFALKAGGTSGRHEIVAGLTTFLTLAYIMFVNPKILGAALAFVALALVERSRGPS